jgi:cyclopropane fatty-acyl-phospholipid synthase-like methyltransferase
MKYTTRKACRVCGSKKLEPILSLGSLYVSTFVKSKKDKVIKAPLELIFCENCTLLQLKHTAPQELLYSGHYWYRSGINPVIVRDLKEIVQVAQKLVRLKKGDIALDIGANDGTLLKYYSKNLVRVGCEPASNLINELRQVTPDVIYDFWNYKLWQKQFGKKKAKVITAIGMFYDMEDPSQFIRDAAKALDEKGVFIAQLMCLRPMLEKNDIGNICHEHLEYYSYESLKYLFEKNGLEIFKVEENDINGGSYRLFARHYKKGSVDFKEKFTKKDYKDFYKRIKENKKACLSFIKQEVKKGKKVYVYGASTKGNTILQYYGLNNKLIKGAADKDPEKWGKFTVGTYIPIISEAEARKEADYFLVLPWAFFKTFYKREKKWLEKGGKFIVPLPYFQVVGKNETPN